MKSCKMKRNKFINDCSEELMYSKVLILVLLPKILLSYSFITSVCICRGNVLKSIVSSSMQYYKIDINNRKYEWLKVPWILLLIAMQ